MQPLRISLIRSHKKGAVRTHVGDLFLDPLKRGESTQKARVVALRCMPQCRCAALHDCDCACSSWTLTTIWWPRAGSCVGVQFPPASSRLILRQPTGPAYRIQPGVPHTAHRPWPVRASCGNSKIRSRGHRRRSRRVSPPRIAAAYCHSPHSARRMADRVPRSSLHGWRTARALPPAERAHQGRSRQRRSCFAGRRPRAMCAVAGSRTVGRIR